MFDVKVYSLRKGVGILNHSTGAGDVFRDAPGRVRLDSQTATNVSLIKLQKRVRRLRTIDDYLHGKRMFRSMINCINLASLNAIVSGTKKEKPFHEDSDVGLVVNSYRGIE